MKAHTRYFCITVLTCLMTLSLPVYADFDDGMAAYQSGDFKKAFAEFKLLAEQGLVGAQFNLGTMYAKGEGVPQDDKEAVFQKVQRNECPNRWV